MEQTDQALKTVIMVGRTEVGKTTLANTLMYGSPEARKTQSIGRIGSIIDTPGEFVENPIYYRAILLNAYAADIVLFLNEADEKESIFPPNFAASFNREVIGVITKMDLGGDVTRARKNLKEAGVSRIFEISVHDAESVKELRDYISQEPQP